MDNVNSTKNRVVSKTSKRLPKTYKEINPLVPLPIKKQKPAPFNHAPLDHDQITEMAYKLWRERGGSDMENWLEAEQRLRESILD